MASTTSPFLLTLTLILTTWATMGSTQQAPPNSPGCIQKLLPCQPYLHATTPPPPTCCSALQQLLEGDTQCLCGIFYNDQLLKSFNVTKEEALNIPKLCGEKADLDQCKTSHTSPAPESLTPPLETPPPPGPAKDSTSAASGKAFVGFVALVWTSLAAWIMC